MNYNEFRKAISKSHVKNIIVGTGIFMFGVFIAWSVLSEADPEMAEIPIGGMIVIWTLAGICLFFGGFITFKQISDAIKMKSGDHPILLAIRNEDKDYLVWIYEYVTKVQGGGSDYQVWTFSRDGKKIHLSLKKHRIQDVIKYLATKFPNATLGYSDDIAAQMRDKFGIK